MDAQAPRRRAVAEADPAFRSVLADVVALVTEPPTLRTKVPPAPGAEPGTAAWRDLGRSDPDFTLLLPDYVEQRYGLTLVALEPPARPTGGQCGPARTHK